NPELPEEERLDNLISLMSLDEKISALGNNTYIPRLGIQGSASVEGLHGVVLGGPTFGENRPHTPTTVFPQSYGLGHTWDTELLHRIATYISTENRYLFQNAKYRRSGLVMWTPNVDLGRDPRWGRTEECFGEDAFLTSQLAVSFIQGIQGEHPTYWRNASLMKHFLANSHEWGRTYTSSDLNEKLFREYYSYPFYKGITAGGSQAMMTAYNAYNGIPCTIHPVLNEIVKNEWGLNGTIITDGGAFGMLLSDHKAFNSRAEAAAACIRAGITKFLDRYLDAVEDAYAQGLISEKEIEEAIRGNLRISLKLGLLDTSPENPYARIGVDDPVEPWTKESTKELVREATRKSVVLLKNDKQLLPLDKSKIKKIAVIGERATQVIEDWYSGTAPYRINVLDAIREEAGEGIEIKYVHSNKMDSARTIAAWADVAIVCVGNHPWCNAGWEQAPIAGEGKEAVDRMSILLDQEDTVMQVYAANPNTVTVLISSFPYAINRIQEKVPAILHVTQSSQELGHGVTDVMFGHYNPAGRLTQTWVKDINDLPHMMDYDITNGRTYMYFKSKPLYPFGHGLSYTTFSYSGIKTNSKKIKEGETLRVELKVRNTGTLDGEEVVQLYISRPGNKADNPIRQLKAFQRIAIPKGETKTVALEVPWTELQVWDEKTKQFILPEGRVKIEVGASSRDIRLQTTL
ncbi:MAG: glycoside hydrolase family 3 C-terminal domain-containing protein, partial [Tannerellaceae bacterium]|nr:glycoside hydrolase family 3 C-terminal domain-containing protein [Tannerellaceae bacterium]